MKSGHLTRHAPKIHWLLSGIGVTAAFGVLAYHSRDR